MSGARAAPGDLDPMDEGRRADEAWGAAGVDLMRRRPRDPRGKAESTVDMILRLEGGTCLYQGGRCVAEDFGKLRQLGIGTVVNCTVQIAPPGWGWRQGAPKWTRFKVSEGPAVGRARARSGAGPTLSELFQPLFDEVEEAKRRGTNLLLHCRSGAHRAGLAMCAVVMHELRLTPNRSCNTYKASAR